MKIDFVSIIIVHYQVEKVLFSCLKTIYSQQVKSKFEVIVVDNGSHAGFEKRLSDQYSQTKYFKAPKNLGYGAGNNFGATQAEGDILFFLNPDTELLPGCVDVLVNFLHTQTNAGIVAPTLLHTNLQLFAQQGSLTLTPLRAIAAHSIVHRLWPNNPISNAFWLSTVSQKNNRKVEVVPGTAVMISRQNFVAVGGFDESFFLYFEEYDMCRRMLALGKEIWMLGNAQIIHVWEGTSKGMNTNEIYRQSLRKYLVKYYGSIIGQLTFNVTQLSKNQLLLILIFALSVFLALLY